MASQILPMGGSALDMNTEDLPMVATPQFTPTQARPGAGAFENLGTALGNVVDRRRFEESSAKKQAAAQEYIQLASKKAASDPNYTPKDFLVGALKLNIIDVPSVKQYAEVIKERQAQRKQADFAKVRKKAFLGGQVEGPRPTETTEGPRPDSQFMGPMPPVEAPGGAEVAGPGQPVQQQPAKTQLEFTQRVAESATPEQLQQFQGKADPFSQVLATQEQMQLKQAKEDAIQGRHEDKMRLGNIKAGIQRARVDSESVSDLNRYMDNSNDMVLASEQALSAIQDKIGEAKMLGNKVVADFYEIKKKKTEMMRDDWKAVAEAASKKIIEIKKLNPEVTEKTEPAKVDIDAKVESFGKEFGF